MFNRGSVASKLNARLKTISRAWQALTGGSLQGAEVDGEQDEEWG